MTINKCLLLINSLIMFTNLRCMDHYGMDFHKAVEQGDINTVQELLKSHKNLVNSLDESGRTSLHNAVFNNRTDMVDLLLKYGANINALEKNKVTPLGIAVSCGHPIMALLLLHHGADTNLVDPHHCGDSYDPEDNEDAAERVIIAKKLLSDWPLYKQYISKQAKTFMLIRNHNESSINSLNDDECQNIIKFLKVAHTPQQIHEIAQRERKLLKK